MMQIHHIASGSDGNAILVSDGETHLLLDAGLSYRKLTDELRQAGVRPSELAGVLLTHEHTDHSKAVPELLRRGSDVYLSLGTFHALNKIKKKNGWESIMPFNPVINPLEFEIDDKGQKNYYQHEIGSWLVKPFDVLHDASEPLGFMFRSEATGDKGVYISDSAIVDYDFKGITHWIIEANYAEDLLEAGDYHPAVKRRVRKNHFSLENLKTFLGTSDLSKTKQIVLVHLSDSNSDAQLFVDELQKLTGVPCYAH